MKHVFEPASFGNLTLQNRLIRSATWEGIAARDGGISENAYAIYDELGKGGVGAIITGFTSVAENDHYFGVMMRLCSDALIPQYKRLAAIYKSEESIGNLPIRMDGFCLFDAKHRSSGSLCLAYKAVQLADPGKADTFLTALRRATVLDCRPTTHFDEILRVVRAVGIDETAFSTCFRDGSAKAALQRDLDLTRSLVIRSLPAYVFRHGDTALLLQSFDYRDFVNAIEQVCR